MARISIATLASLLFACPFAHADQYQDAIAKAFPGFQIMSRSEFHAEVQKNVKTNPALITGQFNNDDLEDFAAIIRSGVKQQAAPGKTRYDGKSVVCHGLPLKGYDCQVLGTMDIYPDLDFYLKRVPPGFSCLLPNGKRIKAKKDGVGTTDILSFGGVKMYMPDGTYYECSED